MFQQNQHNKHRRPRFSHAHHGPWRNCEHHSLSHGEFDPRDEQDFGRSELAPRGERGFSRGEYGPRGGRGFGRGKFGPRGGRGGRGYGRGFGRGYGRDFGRDFNRDPWGINEFGRKLFERRSDADYCKGEFGPREFGHRFGRGYGRGFGRGFGRAEFAGRGGWGRGPSGPEGFDGPGGGGRGGWGGGRGPGGEHRKRFFARGDLKFALLALLEKQPMHGYEMMKALEEQSGGTYVPSAGSIYPTLQMLEDRNFVRVSELEGKKVYTITDEGRAFLAEAQQEREEQGPPHRGRWGGPRGPWQGDAPERGGSLMHELRSFTREFVELWRGSSNNPEKRQRLQSLLDHMRSELANIRDSEQSE